MNRLIRNSPLFQKKLINLEGFYSYHLLNIDPRSIKARQKSYYEGISKNNLILIPSTKGLLKCGGICVIYLK